VDGFDPGALAGATGGDRCFAERQHQSDSAPQGAAQRPSLRPYQIDALARIEAAGARRVLIQAPTGSGKTVIAAALVEAATSRGERVVFLCHRRELTKQTSRKLYDVGVEHGVVQAGFPTRPGEPVQVASIATLHARAIRCSAMELPPADLVIVDEAHHCRARTWQRLIDAYPKATIIGLSATPCRSDGRGLGRIFDELIEVSTVADLIASRHLVPAKVFAPTKPDLGGVRVERGDYVESQLAARMNTAALVGDIVEHWHKLGEQRRTVIFAVDVAHSVHLRDEFRRSGVLAEHIDGSTPLEKRDAVLARLARGKIEIVTNCQVLTEGWDCPEVACLVLATPTKSLGLYLQMAGRVLRPAPGKTDALILDHSGAVFQHGFVDDPIKWTLDEDRRAENKAHSARWQYNAPALTTCPECSAVRFQGQPCPACGWRPVTKPRHVDIADGTLGVVDRNRNVADVPVDEALNWYQQLLYIAREKGYKDGWAYHKVIEKFGPAAAPRGRHHSPLTPEPTVRAWVRSRLIAYAKAMARTP
jgi:superfamily II DNA or RNA helicase